MNDEVLDWQGCSHLKPRPREFLYFRILHSLFSVHYSFEHRTLNTEWWMMKAGIGMVIVTLFACPWSPHPSVFGVHNSVFVIPLNIERWTSNDEWWSFGLARLFPFEASSSGISVLQNSTFIIQCSLFLWTSNAEHRMMNDEGLDWNGHRQIVRLSLVSSSFGVRCS